MDIFAGEEGYYSGYYIFVEWTLNENFRNYKEVLFKNTVGIL